MDEFVFDILVAVCSLLAGVIGALIGLGGGVIITPLLVLAFGVDIRYAMGAALCSVIATSSGAAAAYLRDGISNMRIGLFLCVATTIGAVCGALLAVVLDQAVLSVIFGAALLATVLLSLREKKNLSGSDASDPLAVRLRLPGTMPTQNGPFRTPFITSCWALASCGLRACFPDCSALAQERSRLLRWIRSCGFPSRSQPRRAIS